MNYSNQHLHGHFPYNQPQFMPWNQSPYTLPPMPQPHFPSYSHNPPLNLLVQQQNNYFNSNFSMQSSPHQDYNHLNSGHPYSLPMNWMPRPEAPRSPVKEVIKKKKLEVICLDDDSPIEAIVIEDSIELIQ